MYIPTRLRVLRARYGISLRMLSACMHISNQQLSRMELLYIPPTAYHEQQLSLGIERLLAEWPEAPEGLKQYYETYRGRLLQPAKEAENEH